MPSSAALHNQGVKPGPQTCFQRHSISSSGNKAALAPCGNPWPCRRNTQTLLASLRKQRYNHAMVQRAAVVHAGRACQATQTDMDPEANTHAVVECKNHKQQSRVALWHCDAMPLNEITKQTLGARHSRALECKAQRLWLESSSQGLGHTSRQHRHRTPYCL